eukprot:RCo034750
MGLLSVGQPIPWEMVTQEMCDHVRLHGALQFLHQYRAHQDREEGLQLKWGEEIEYHLLRFTEEGRVHLQPRVHEVLEQLSSRASECSPCSTIVAWHPEYANWMIEATPGQPYGNLTAHLLMVEPNMSLRRKCPLPFLREGEALLSITVHPRLGAPDCLPPAQPTSLPLPGPVAQSVFLPDEVITPHPRFPTLTGNIRKRRGSKVDIRVPLFMDKHTTAEVVQQARDGPGAPSSEPNPDERPHVYMDAMGFGMGSSCLQMTFQARNLTEARLLYDQLAVVAPLMLALTAATPAYRGFLVDTDVRWNQISASVDDRTPFERGLVGLPEAANGPRCFNGNHRLGKSRYSSVSMFVSESVPDHCNDLSVPYNEKIFELLTAEGVDVLLAKHVAHLFVRDPLVMYEGKLDLDDTASTDHFENLNSTNWNSMRLKLPPPGGQIGWRVEFRTMEVQMTDFENAAFVIFIVLLSRIILAFHLDFYMPVSLVDENMQRAHNRNAVLAEKFFFRHMILQNDACGSALLEGLRFVPSRTDGARSAMGRSPDSRGSLPEAISRVSFYEDQDHETTSEMTIDEIINGLPGIFPGLMPLVHNYLDMIECSGEARSVLDSYLTLISWRASGRVQTPATWMRAELTRHPSYRGDSVVPPEACHDL